MLFPLYRGGSLAELGERLAAEGRSLPTREALLLFLQASAPQHVPRSAGSLGSMCHVRGVKR